MGSRGTLLGCLIATGLLGCVVPLDTTTASTTSDTTSTPVMSSCALWPTLSVSGPVHDFTLPSGATAWTWDDGARGNVATGVGLSPCANVPTSVQPAIPATDTEERVTLLDVVTTGTITWQFFETWRLEAGQPFGVRTLGRGVARWDPATGQFSGPRTMLWLSDQPGFGRTALVDGGWLYTWGCVSTAGGWERACMLGRVDPLRADQPNAWQYATGSHQFAADVALAQPVLSGVGDVSVRRHPQSGRLLVTYIKPLDHIVYVRTALAPDGPFSSPHVLGGCPDVVGAFCVGADQHPAFDPDATRIAITWSMSALDAMPKLDRGTHWSVVALPPELP